MNNIATYYSVKLNLLQRHYKKKISGLKQQNKLNQAKNYLIYPQNKGANLCVDALSLSKGEPSTFVTNKSRNGKKTALVASIKGTKSQDNINVGDQIA